LSCFVLDGNGGAQRLTWSEIERWQPADGVLWLHLDRSADATERWLEKESGLDPLAVDALLAEETRPRLATIGDGVMVMLRGVNLNPGADPEDMVSLRLWVDATRVISVQGRPVMAVKDLAQRLELGRGPRDPAELFVQLAARLVERMGPVIDELDDDTSRLEEELLESTSRETRHTLREVRSTAIALRRYLAPQRDVLTYLHTETLTWLDKRHLAHLREIADRVIRYVEDLEEVRERAAIIQDELVNQQSEKINRNMYLLSVVAAVMLPLSFLTGLLGINVGGIPLANNGMGFTIVCAVLAGIIVIEILIVRHLHWL